MTQNRVASLFTDPAHADCLGYRHLGDWRTRENNRGIEARLLRNNVTTRGYTAAQVGAALQKLETAADSTGITPYQANLRTYQPPRSLRGDHGCALPRLARCSSRIERIAIGRASVKRMSDGRQATLESYAWPKLVNSPDDTDGKVVRPN